MRNLDHSSVTDIGRSRGGGSGLVELLDRVLDKGLVVAGDIKVSLAEVELITIRIRLIICSIDKAQEVGLDWWRHDQHLTGRARNMSLENEELRAQIARLERKVELLTPAAPVAARRRRRRRKR